MTPHSQKLLPSIAFKTLLCKHLIICNFLIFHSILIGFGADCISHALSVNVAVFNLQVISYTMGFPPVRGDNPRALASGLSYVQADKHGITIVYHLHQCRLSTS